MWNMDILYTRVKFCWFEYPEAALEASGMGIDMLGFHIFSDDDVDEKISRFQYIFQFLPASTERVLLTDLAFDEVLHVLGKLRFDSVQLYPDWEQQKISQLRRMAPNSIRILKVMSAVSSENFTPNDSEFLDRYYNSADAILLDSFRRGGTGQIADLDHCATIVSASRLPVILGGGLNSENVRSVIRRVRPFGVDVESGISTKFHSELMMKDMHKCRKFINAVVAEDRHLLRERARHFS